MDRSSHLSLALQHEGFARTPIWLTRIGLRLTAARRLAIEHEVGSVIYTLLEAARVDRTPAGVGFRQAAREIEPPHVDGALFPNAGRLLADTANPRTAAELAAVARYFLHYSFDDNQPLEDAEVEGLIRPGEMDVLRRQALSRYYTVLLAYTVGTVPPVVAEGGARPELHDGLMTALCRAQIVSIADVYAWMHNDVEAMAPGPEAAAALDQLSGGRRVVVRRSDAVRRGDAAVVYAVAPDWTSGPIGEMPVAFKLGASLATAPQAAIDQLATDGLVTQAPLADGPAYALTGRGALLGAIRGSWRYAGVICDNRRLLLAG